MKLKLSLLVALACAGGGASVALADHGGHDGHGPACRSVHLRGTVAAQSLALTVARADKRTGVAAGSTVSLALPAGARVEVEACVTGTGASAAYSVRHAELNVKPAKPATTTQTTTTS
jgi:hypothetical protein